MYLEAPPEVLRSDVEEAEDRGEELALPLHADLQAQLRGNPEAFQHLKLCGIQPYALRIGFGEALFLVEDAYVIRPRRHALHSAEKAPHVQLLLQVRAPAERPRT